MSVSFVLMLKAVQRSQCYDIKANLKSYKPPPSSFEYYTYPYAHILISFVLNSPSCDERCRWFDSHWRHTFSFRVCRFPSFLIGRQTKSSMTFIQSNGRIEADRILQRWRLQVSSNYYICNVSSSPAWRDSVKAGHWWYKTTFRSLPCLNPQS